MRRCHVIVTRNPSGRFDRRELLRRGTLAGLCLPLAPALATGCDSGGSPSPAAGSTTRGGGGDALTTVRLSLPAPAAEVDPLRSDDAGSRALVALTGEFLCLDRDGRLVPWLAERWTANADASEWTFQIRAGVRFNDGTAMTAHDVAASLSRLARERPRPALPSAATTSLPDCRVRAPDPHTVVISLAVPNGCLPYHVSNDNPWAVVLPAGEREPFGQRFPGSGPWSLAGRRPDALSFQRNPGYWGEAALPAALEVTLAADSAAQLSALQAGQVDVVSPVTVADAAAILDDSRYDITAVPAAGHGQLTMRCDAGPFRDARVRRALALCLARDDITHALLQGRADVGNDSPFAPAFAQTSPAPAQREQNLVLARRLLAEAGLANGFSTELVAIRDGELPGFARIVSEAAADLGIAVTPRMLKPAEFYGAAVPGRSPWLDASFSLVGYGHCGVADAYLSASLRSDGAWNAARFHDAGYDALVAGYREAIGLPQQRALAGQIERLLLEQTPVVIAYFANHLTAAGGGLTGLRTSAAGQVWVDQLAVA